MVLRVKCQQTGAKLPKGAVLPKPEDLPDPKTTPLLSKNVLLAVFSLSLHLVEALVTYAMFALTPRSMVSLMLKI